MALSFSQWSRSKTFALANGDEVREFEKAEYADESQRESLGSEYSEDSSQMSEESARGSISVFTVRPLNVVLLAHTSLLEDVLQKF